MWYPFEDVTFSETLLLSLFLNFFLSLYLFMIKWYFLWHRPKWTLNLKSFKNNTLADFGLYFERALPWFTIDETQQTFPIKMYVPASLLILTESIFLVNANGVIQLWCSDKRNDTPLYCCQTNLSGKTSVFVGNQYCLEQIM